jgi:hypothetical protein
VVVVAAVDFVERASVFAVAVSYASLGSAAQAIHRSPTSPMTRVACFIVESQLAKSCHARFGRGPISVLLGRKYPQRISDGSGFC